MIFESALATMSDTRSSLKEAKTRFPEEVETILSDAGWYPGRCALPADLPRDYQIFPIARAALEEFGGLHVGSCSSGRDFARSDIQFVPDAAEGLAVHVLKTDEGRQLYPLGEVHQGHAFLFIDEAGMTFLHFDELQKVGDTLDEALVCLLLGVNACSS